MVEEGSIGLDENMNEMLPSNNGINTSQKAQDFKDEGKGNLECIVDQGQIEITKAEVDTGNVVMDSGEAQIQTDEENMKFISNDNDEKYK
ncbi:hypothetical protein O181_003841 [Austropuccinia psidii MF-1]|uniref:Uncharacterized protein n=1 Tax=Austropuccinia psidii MF-1 TaxID=1389203 RepID=A0A9Q3GEH5_9BASI|nr:hypothetical protein [Austropuccinia psidii MF-1]